MRVSVWLRDCRWNLAARGANVFITGPAGTGKSVVLRKILAHFREKYSCREGCYVAVAPTGPTAISVGGQTIHSFAGCGVPKTAGDFDKCWEKFKRENWRKLHAIVIEEISMISGEFLDRLSTVVSMIREDRQPFGGIQLILCGDFLQLRKFVARLVRNLLFFLTCHSSNLCLRFLCPC